MCLGIPAEVLRTHGDHPDLMVARLAGDERTINVAILDRTPSAGEWVMVHMGCALEFITAEQAADATSVLSDDASYFDRLLAERREDHAADGDDAT